jgi:hypothetical protein
MSKRQRHVFPKEQKPSLNWATNWATRVQDWTNVLLESGRWGLNSIIEFRERCSAAVWPRKKRCRGRTCA